MHKHPKGDIFLIPIKFDKCEAPDDLIDLHWINIFNKNGYYKLIHSMKIKLPKKKVYKRDLTKEGAIIQIDIGIPEFMRSMYTKSKKEIPPYKRLNALIDTGAYRTVIKRNILDELRIPPEGIENIELVTSYKKMQNIFYRWLSRFIAPDGAPLYSVNIRLSSDNTNLVDYNDIMVVGLYFDYGREIDAIIGHDILKHYKFIYHGKLNKFEFLGY